MNLLTLRDNIDRLDDTLLETLEQRFKLVHDIGLQKDKSFYVGRPIREAEQLTRWMRDFPELPLPTLLAIFRALVTTAITKEVAHFTVHSAKQTETIASNYYGVADIICHQNAKQLFTAQQAADGNKHQHFISIIPLDDASYWPNETIGETIGEIIGKNLSIIEALPIESEQKQAVILGYLPDEFIPHNHLFYCDDMLELSDDIKVFATMDNKVIYCYHSNETWQTAHEKLSNQTGNSLAITYLGGYSVSVQNALKSQNVRNQNI